MSIVILLLATKQDHGDPLIKLWCYKLNCYRSHLMCVNYVSKRYPPKIG